MIREIRKSIKHERRHVRVDWMVALTLLILLIFSCIMVYSASMIGNKYGTFTSSVPVEASYFLKERLVFNHLLWLSYSL